MKKLVSLLALVVVVAAAAPAFAVVNAPVNIAYPIAFNANDNYFKVSFSVTCPGGQNTVKWALDGTAIGFGEYYDTFSTQFLQKAGTGWHTLDVATNCGQDQVIFWVN